jgi:hypothetical protein
VLFDWCMSINRPYLYSLLPENTIKSGLSDTILYSYWTVNGVLLRKFWQFYHELDDPVFTSLDFVLLLSSYIVFYIPIFPTCLESNIFLSASSANLFVLSPRQLKSVRPQTCALPLVLEICLFIRACAWQVMLHFCICSPKVFRF